jgi:hypothetical protein
MISNILDGLAILKTYNADAPIVAHAYILAIPAIKVAVVTGEDAAALEALDWEQHPVYLCYYYPTKTLTELADVTGAEEKDPPPFPVILPAPRS